MARIKHLFKETIWYGFSSIFGRFLNYLLTPLYTFIFAEQLNGQIGSTYALITFFNIVFTFNIETYYFKNSTENKQKIFNNCFSFLLIVNLVGGILFLLNIQNIASITYTNSRLILYCMLCIIVSDALATMPFAFLRLHGKVKKYVLIRLTNIGLNIFFNIYFLVICPHLIATNKYLFLVLWYQPAYTIEYIFIANLIASVITLILLLPNLKIFRWQINIKQLKKIFSYSAPLIIISFAGMINEVLDRIMLPLLLEGTKEYKLSQNGIYSANYKLSILIVLFIQAFRMAGEPFFFKLSVEKDARYTYARIMNFFVIICCFGFLSVTLFLNFWKHFISADTHKGFAEGLKVVPILLIGNVFLGIYYNISIWYKLKNKTLIGAGIAIIGALITLIGNYIFIPHFSFLACAITTCICYFIMMVLCYFIGRKYFVVPYQIGKISIYLICAFTLGIIHFKFFFHINFILSFSIAIFFIFTFTLLVIKTELNNIKTIFNKQFLKLKL